MNNVISAESPKPHPSSSCKKTSVYVTAMLVLPLVLAGLGYWYFSAAGRKSKRLPGCMSCQLTYYGRTGQSISGSNFEYIPCMRGTNH